MGPSRLLLVLLLACGGTPSRRSAAIPASGPVDVAAMRALLERYSPTGWYLLGSFETLPRRFVLADTTITLSSSARFGDFFDDASPEKLVSNMDTAVHEVYHGYASLMGHQLLVETRTPRGAGAEAVYLDRQPMLVSFTASYPAREMDATFPAGARTFRYATYVSPSGPTQSTQQEGVYGLLDELTAYYHGARTTLDLWPWVRDEAPADEEILRRYLILVHDVSVPHAEFKLFILHYLLVARSDHPDVYRAIMANQSFRRAFVACDDAYVALQAEADRLQPTLDAFARSRGLSTELRDGELVVGSWTYHRDAAHPGVLRALASPPYQAMLSELRAR